MGWKPLDDDVPLDHETLVPPEPAPAVADAPAPAAAPGDPAAPEAAAPKLVELPPDAQLDPAPDAGPPAVATAVGPVKGVDATPTYTEKGFADTMSGDATYHSTLSDADKAEYASFFADPSKPPTPEFLRKWFHDKTGAYFGNAEEVVDAFKKSGQFNTAQNYVIPTQSRGKAGSYSQHTANALLADFGPEISAPFGAIGLGTEDRPDVFNSDASFGDLVSQNADITRAQLDRDTAEHPVMSGLGEATGAIAAAPVGGAAADAVGAARLGKLGATAAKAAAGGAAYGAGAGGPGHRLEGAGVGAVAAPLVAVGLKVPTAGYRAAASVFETAPAAARRIIAKAIEDDANTPAKMGQDIAEAHDNGVPMAPADTGENVRGLLAASSRASGLGRTVARDALEERQAGLADRVVSHIERDLGPIANPHELADQMMTNARDTAAPLYKQAYAAPVPDAFVEKLKPILQRPSVQKALGNARKIAQEEGDDPDAIGLVVRDGQTLVGAAPSWKTLDYIKRGLDDVVETYRDSTTGKLNLNTEGKAVNNTLRQYIGMLDAANPAYKEARAAYAGEVKGIAAMNDGRKALNLTADDLEAKMRGMSPYEKEMYALGARRAMAETVRSKGDTADVVNALVGTGKKRAMLARLFAPNDRKAFQRFVDTLSQEKEGWRTFKQSLLGSPTAANHADDAALEFAVTAAELTAHGGIPVATGIRKASKFLGRQVSEKVQQQIAALLSNTDPAALGELAAQLHKAAVRRGIKLKLGKTVRVGVGNSAAPVMTEQAQ
jgi:hypothetical protein